MTRRSRSGRRRIWANHPYLSDYEVEQFFATVNRIREARIATESAQTSAPPQPNVMFAKSEWSHDEHPV